MLDERWASRPILIERKKRHAQWAAHVVKHSGMPLDTCALYMVLIDRPERWELKQSWVVSEGYAKEKRVRRMFKDMIDAGRMRIARRHGPDGKLIPGIYELSDEPKWLAEPMDNRESIDGFENIEAAQIAEGNTFEGRASDRREDIYNSRVHPVTSTSPGDVEKPVDPTPLKAESRDCGSKASPTEKGEAEPRHEGAAKAHLPQKEPGKSPAKGSAVKGVPSGGSDVPAKDRYTERLIGQMVDTAAFSGSRMPNPRQAAGAVPCLIQWQMEELDFERDVLPAIADVCRRVGDPDKSIVSWRYFTAAIREAHRRRVRPAEPAPRPAARRQLEGWTPAGAAYQRRR